MLLNTHNDLPEEARFAVVDFLNKRLAEAIDLVYQAKQAHWNVKGYEFRSLHKLFDELADEMDPFVDLIAERVSQLGGVVLGTVQASARNTTLKAYPLAMIESREHLTILCKNFAAFGKAIRGDIDLSAGLSDHATEDILTEIARTAEKLTWILESHLMEEAELQGEVPKIQQQRSRKASAA